MSNLRPDFDPIESQLDALLPRSRQNCPPLDLLLAAGTEVLPPEAEASVQQHLLHCKLCATLLVDLASLPESSLSPARQAQIAAALPIPHANRTVGLPSRRFLASIAAIAALLLFAVAIIQWRHPVSQPLAKVVQPPTSAPPVAVAQLEIPLTPLAPPGPGMALPLTRGSRTGPDPSTDQLLPAFESYNRKDYAQAARRFTPLASAYPRSALVALYFGVTQLFLEQNQSAYRSLETASLSRTPSIAEPAAWYQAIAAQRLHAADAKARFESICHDSTSRYSQQSCAAASRVP